MSLLRSSFFAGVFTGFAIISGLALADGPANTVPLLPKYKQECAACHTPYPAGMLPVGSWKRVMAGLNKHYGTDASMDEASVREISAWLGANAGTYKRVSEEPPQDRITQSAWFLRKHNAREVAPEVWKRASVGSASNCVACHTNAAQGNFNERDIRIPK
ncbi:MAG: diheme cytochrome c [Pseudomonadota bacterium]